MKKIILVLVLLFSTCYAQQDILNGFKSNRADIYKHLNLSESQMFKVRNIDEKMYEKLTPEMINISNYTDEMKNLVKRNDFTIEEVNVIKDKFDKTNENISLIKDDYEKEFKSVLNGKQKIRYFVEKRKLRAKLTKELKQLKKTAKNG